MGCKAVRDGIARNVALEGAGHGFPQPARARPIQRLLIAGAVIGFGAKPICRREQNVPQMKLLGVGLAAIGAILIFLP